MQRMQHRHYLFVIPLIWCFVLVHDVHAIGLAVSPSRVELSSGLRDPVETTVAVENASNEVAYFEAYPDAFDAMIKITPKSFTLEAGESRSVLVSAESESLGQFKTELSIVARPLSETVYAAAGGIKIPFALTVTESRIGMGAAALSALTTPPTLLLVVLFCIGFGLFLYRLYRDRRPS